MLEYKNNCHSRVGAINTETPAAVSCVEGNLMTNLTVFCFESQDVRFVDGKPVAIDVARVLGYTDPASTINKKVSNKNKGVAKMATPGGIQSVTVLEEAGIYQLIFSSKLPSAEKFQDWVFEEVLPSLRQTGTYTIALSDIEEKEPRTEIDLIAQVTTLVLLPNINQILVSGVVANNIGKAFPEYKWLVEETKKHLPPLPVSEPLLTVTQLCQIVLEMTGKKISAIALNKKLQERNLQIKNQVDNPRWLPTDMGKEHGQIVLDTARGRNKTIQVLKWHSTVLDLVDLN